MIKKDNIIEHYKQLWNTEEDKKIWNKADRRISKITQEEYLKYLDECKYGDSEKKQKFENFIKSFASQQIIENLKTTTMKDYKISSSYDKSGGVEKQLSILTLQKNSDNKQKKMIKFNLQDNNTKPVFTIYNLIGKSLFSIFQRQPKTYSLNHEENLTKLGYEAINNNEAVKKNITEINFNNAQISKSFSFLEKHTRSYKVAECILFGKYDDSIKNMLCKYSHNCKIKDYITIDFGSTALNAKKYEKEMSSGLFRQKVKDEYENYFNDIAVKHLNNLLKISPELFILSIYEREKHFFDQKDIRNVVAFALSTYKKRLSDISTIEFINKKCKTEIEAAIERFNIDPFNLFDIIIKKVEEENNKENNKEEEKKEDLNNGEMKIKTTNIKKTEEIKQDATKEVNSKNDDDQDQSSQTDHNKIEIKLEDEDEANKNNDGQKGWCSCKNNCDCGLSKLFGSCCGQPQT